MESERDHIHILFDYDPSVSVLQIVRRYKQMSTYRLWKVCNLSRYFWNERTFWSDGYFACSTGDASTEVIRQYIETQGLLAEQ